MIDDEFLILVPLLAILLLPYLLHLSTKVEIVTKVYRRPKEWVNASTLNTVITLLIAFAGGMVVFNGLWITKGILAGLLGMWFWYLNFGIILDAAQYFRPERIEPMESESEEDAEGPVPSIGEVLAAMEAQLAEAMQEVGHLRGELTDVLSTIDGLRSRLHESSEGLEGSVEAAGEDQARIEALLAEATAKAERIQGEIDESEARAENIREDMAVVQKEVERIEGVKERVEEEIEEKASSDSPIGHDDPYTASDVLVEARELEDRILGAAGATSKRARSAFRLGFREED